MKTFLLILVLAVLAAVAIRVWLIGSNEAEQMAEIGVATEQVVQGEEAEPVDGELNNPVESVAEMVEFDPNEATNRIAPESQGEIPIVNMSELRDVRDLVRFAGLEPGPFLEYADSWYRERGRAMYMPGFAGSADPTQPYEQYDEQTLISFAESGDPWAQQILGKKWHWSRPADSVAMLQRAAEQGSAFAMAQLGRFYNTVSSLEDIESRFSGEALTQMQAILDAPLDLRLESARWMGAAEIASGGWMSGPDQGNFTRDNKANLEMSPERQSEICGLALQTYQDLRDAQAAAGQAPIPVTAPPFINRSQVSGYCDTPDWPRPDISHCRMVRVAQHGSETTQLFGLCPPSP